MANSDDYNIAYLLNVIKNATQFAADYRAVATDMNIASANNAQKKFKALVERSGQYKLVAGQVVDNPSWAGPGSSNNDTTTAAAVNTPANTKNSGGSVPATPKKRKSAGKATDPATPESTPASNKRVRKSTVDVVIAEKSEHED